MDDSTKARVRALLEAIRQRPATMPLEEVVELASEPVTVTVDRAGEEPVVFVEPRPDPRFDVLSDREYEVATLVAAGFSNRQIAEALFISMGTVKDHVHSILTKTELASRAEVAACWYGNL